MVTISIKWHHSRMQIHCPSLKALTLEVFASDGFTGARLLDFLVSMPNIRYIKIGDWVDEEINISMLNHILSRLNLEVLDLLTFRGHVTGSILSSQRQDFQLPWLEEITTTACDSTIRNLLTACPSLKRARLRKMVSGDVNLAQDIIGPLSSNSNLTELELEWKRHDSNSNAVVELSKQARSWPYLRKLGVYSPSR